MPFSNSVIAMSLLANPSSFRAVILDRSGPVPWGLFCWSSEIGAG
jgi:hypothetical protein